MTRHPAAIRVVSPLSAPTSSTASPTRVERSRRGEVLGPGLRAVRGRGGVDAGPGGETRDAPRGRAGERRERGGGGWESAARRRSSGGGSENDLSGRSGRPRSRGEGRRAGRQTRGRRAWSGAIARAAAPAFRTGRGDPGRAPRPGGVGSGASAVWGVGKRRAEAFVGWGVGGGASREVRLAAIAGGGRALGALAAGRGSLDRSGGREGLGRAACGRLAVATAAAEAAAATVAGCGTGLGSSGRGRLGFVGASATDEAEEAEVEEAGGRSRWACGGGGRVGG